MHTSWPLDGRALDHRWRQRQRRQDPSIHALLLGVNVASHRAGRRAVTTAAPHQADRPGGNSPCLASIEHDSRKYHKTDDSP
jgi:hypothetical protein